MRCSHQFKRQRENFTVTTNCENKLYYSNIVIVKGSLTVAYQINYPKFS